MSVIEMIFDIRDHLIQLGYPPELKKLEYKVSW